MKFVFTDIYLLKKLMNCVGVSGVGYPERTTYSSAFFMFIFYSATNCMLFSFAYVLAADPLLPWIVSEGQPPNAHSPIVVTLSGMVMLVRPSQPENALLPIFETLSGMVMLVRLVQL